MSSKLRGYQLSISEAINCDNPAICEEIEDIMRREIFHSTLDWQTKGVFDRGAREAVLVLKELHKMGEYPNLDITPF